MAEQIATDRFPKFYRL